MENGSSRFRLPWTLPAQRVARREPAATPLDWRRTIRSRLLVCAVAFAAWTAGIEARLVYLQVIAHQEMTVLANRQHLKTVTPAAKRGEIVDRNGHVLAYSVDADTIAADPSEVVDPVRTASLVCEALDACQNDKRKLLADRLSRRGQFVFLERQVSPLAARRVKDLNLPGIAVIKESRRYYPKRELAAHVLGYVGIDNKGLAGLEAAFDSKIRGREGRMLLQADGRQKALAVREERPPTAGDSLELTIDQYLQHIAERELRAGVEEFNAAGGAVVVMDPSNGEILALANYPTFNPNAFTAADDETRKNRAIQNVYEPGSTFKLVTASAALEEGVLHPTDLIDCAPGFITFPGRKPIRDVHRYGQLTFEDVIVKSSNVGAIKAGLRIGPERLGRYINRFGFGQALSPDFRGESAGIVWNPAKLDPSGLASVSMGYQISVTPLQMAAAVSSVANGGTLYEPRLVRAFLRNGRREPVVPRALRRTVSEETAATMTTIMESVVERGTATAARIGGYTIAGKTGTAAKLVNGRYSDRDYNVSFVGFVPSRKPALTIIVVIDSPHGRVKAYGGTVAAPIFRRIAEASLRHLGVPPSLNAPPPVLVARVPDEEIQPRPVSARPPVDRVLAPARDGLMPDLRGMSARQALTALGRIGLRPHVIGDGFVIEQAPEPGAPLVPGDGAVLRLGRRVPAVPASAAQPAGGPGQ
ncbi:MAG TPA: penicillin-binding protein [Vicinamibacterales bacterium]|nr:penicillin-binding protein [Vicinamibacterales bacterium]